MATRKEGMMIVVGSGGKGLRGNLRHAFNLVVYLREETGRDFVLVSLAELGPKGHYRMVEAIRNERGFVTGGSDVSPALTPANLITWIDGWWLGWNCGVGMAKRREVPGQKKASRKTWKD